MSKPNVAAPTATLRKLSLVAALTLAAFALPATRPAAAITCGQACTNQYVACRDACADNCHTRVPCYSDCVAACMVASQICHSHC